MMDQRFIFHKAAGTSLTRLELQLVSSQQTHGSGSCAVALRAIIMHRNEAGMPAATPSVTRVACKKKVSHCPVEQCCAGT